MIGSISDDGMVHVTCTLGAGWYRYQVPTCVCMWSHQAVATPHQADTAQLSFSCASVNCDQDQCQYIMGDTSNNTIVMTLSTECDHLTEMLVIDHSEALMNLE